MSKPRNKGTFQQPVSVPAGGTASASLVVASPHVCQFPDSILFDVSMSFVAPTPNNKNALKWLLAFTEQQGATLRLFIVGHTDSTGSRSRNQAISERRARSVYAVLQGDTDDWEDLYGIEGWSSAQLTEILVETGEVDPKDSSAVSSAVRRYQGRANQAARADLFGRYFSRLADPAIVSNILYATITPPWIGCGEDHLLRGDRSNPSRNPNLPEIIGDFQDNRRVEFFFVEDGINIPLSSIHYPNWTATCSLVTPTPAIQQWFVSARLGQDNKATGRGASKTLPFRTIRFALEHVGTIPTAATDQIVVMDGTYREDIQLKSNTILIADQGATPKIERSTQGTPVISCQGISNVSIKGLAIDGRGQGGHGIVIQNSQNIEIVSSRIESNRASDHGGGIRIRSSRDVTVSGCRITGNFAPRGGGIAILDSVQVTIGNDNTIDQNEAGTIDTAVTYIDIDAAVLSGSIDRFEITVGHAHGGGICIQDSQRVSIQHNRILENRAILFGGGIAIDNRPGFNGSLDISDNEITCNQVAHGNLQPLTAPVDCSVEDMGDPVLTRMEGETVDKAAAECLDRLHGVGIESGMGGGIALRHVSSRTRLLRNRIGGEWASNRARRGGGIECFNGAYPYLEGNNIANNLASDDGGGISIDQFDPFLPRRQPRFLGFVRGAYFPRRSIRMVSNRIRSNRAIRDGGGVYATGNALVEISGNGTQIVLNEAGENGGGIRISYATRLSINGGRIWENRCNSVAAGPDRDGGGGLAARNAAFDVRNCNFQGNEANQFAGGAVYCNSTWEGGFNESGPIRNQRGQFDEIMEQDFGFRTRRYVIADSVAIDNRATGNSGAGGFLYSVRASGNIGGGERMFVFIKGSHTRIETNISEHSDQKRGNVVIDFSNRQVRGFAGIPEDIVFIMASSIQQSTPPPSNHRIVVLNPDGISTQNTDYPTVLPYSNAPAPQITGVSPNVGITTRNTPVRISGSGFDPASEVFIGSKRAVNVRVISPDLIEAEVPTGSPSSVDVMVQIPDGRSVTLPGAFTYNPPPQITGIRPEQIPVNTPDVCIAVYGKNFQSGAIVAIEYGNARVELPTTFVSSQELEAEIPLFSTPEFVYLEVRNPDGGTYGWKEILHIHE